MEDDHVARVSIPRKLPESSKTTERFVYRSKCGQQRKAAIKRHALAVATFTVFLFVCVLHILGILLFTKGFLLTRLVLDQQSECTEPPIAVKDNFPKFGSGAEGCWHPKSFEKAIVVVIDALRYDFTVPFKGSNDEGEEEKKQFHDALTVLHEIASESPQHAFLRPFIADPPTTTLQRLKGLTTGSLPTFVDAGSNFAGTAIEEDNLLSQLRDAGKRIVHLGDDTWHALFPGHFVPNLTHAYDSFNVWDLHTVDDGVNDHLFPLLEGSNTTTWDVVIAHFLGVDHAGHRYGPDHRAMGAKLKQMDTILRRLIAMIDNDTLLVVIGDHGMDSKGDHGGESDDEVQAAIWMYSRNPFFGRTPGAQILPPANGTERPVAQIDFVPSMAMLLGLPIPFNNLGAPIEEAFVGIEGVDWENLARVTRLTASQVERYQAEYDAVRSFDKATIADLRELWGKANQAWSLVQSQKTIKDQNWEHLYENYQRYLRSNLAICRSLWAKFDISKMISGIIVLALALVLLLLYGRTKLINRSEVSIAIIINGLLGALLGFVISIVVNVPLMFSISISIELATARVLLLQSGWKSWIPQSFWSRICLIFTLSLAAGFASNSFIVWEDRIVLFYSTSIGLLLIVSSVRSFSQTKRVLGVQQGGIFMLLLRLASFSRLCREEQIPLCRSTYYSSSASSSSSLIQACIPLLVAVFVPIVLKQYSRATDSYHASAIPYVSLTICPALAFTAMYWIVDAADDRQWIDWGEPAITFIKTSLAQATLFVALFVGLTTYIWGSSLVTNVHRESSQDVRFSSSQTDSSAHNDGSSFSSIGGVKNIFGSRYQLLVAAWFLVLVCVQKPVGIGTTAILLWQILCILELLSVNNIKSSPLGPVLFALLGSFHFFTTGHQTTLASIQWDSAFVPFKSLHYPWAPILVILNSFGPQILCAIAVPMITLWRQHPRAKDSLSKVGTALATHQLFYATINVATTVWAGWLRRHLMLFRVFFPKFMTAAVVFLVVDIFCIFIALTGSWWTYASVARAVGW